MSTFDQVLDGQLTRMPCAVNFGSIHSLASSAAHPNMVYLGCDDGRVVAFDIERQQVVHERRFLEKGDLRFPVESSLDTIVVHPTTGLIYVASFRYLWVLSPDFKILSDITLDGLIGARLALSPDSRHLAVSDDAWCRVYLVENRQKPKRLKGFAVGKYAQGICFSADGRYVYVGSYPDYDADNMRCDIQIWDWYLGDQMGTLPGHTGVILSLVAAPDGATLISSAEDFTLRRWDLRTGTELPVKGTAMLKEWQLAYSPDFSVLGTASLSRTAALRHPETLETVWQYITEGAQVTSVAFSPDGRTVLFGESRGELQVWRLG